MDLHYIIKDGLYMLMDGADILWTGKEVAIAFSYYPDEPTRMIMGTLHKHGDPHLVEKWADANRKKLIEAGHNDLANEIIVISSNKFSVEDLNKMISISGYVGKWYANLTVKLQKGGENNG